MLLIVNNSHEKSKPGKLLSDVCEAKTSVFNFSHSREFCQASVPGALLWFPSAINVFFATVFMTQQDADAYVKSNSKFTYKEPGVACPD